MRRVLCVCVCVFACGWVSVSVGLWECVCACARCVCACVVEGGRKEGCVCVCWGGGGGANFGERGRLCWEWLAPVSVSVFARTNLQIRFLGLTCGVHHAHPLFLLLPFR